MGRTSQLEQTSSADGNLLVHGFRKIEQRVWPPTTSFGAGWSTSSVKSCKTWKPFQHKRKVVMSKRLRLAFSELRALVGQRFVTLCSKTIRGSNWSPAASRTAPARPTPRPSAAAGRWKRRCPEFVKNMVVKNVADVEDVVQNVDFVFSAVNMPKD